jgi:hypothetical protein
MLATRDDIFDHYTQPDFEAAFDRWFTIENAVAVRDAERVVYVMRRRQ